MSITSVSPAVYQVPAQRTIPRVAPKNVADLPQEEQDAIRARHAEMYARIAEHDRKMANMKKLIQNMRTGGEVQSRHAPNVAGLSREQSLRQIESMSELIRSGDAERVPFFSGNGTQTTTNARQYVSWLQQHVKGLDSAGEVTPEPVSTGTAGGPFPADYVSEIKRLRTDVPGVKYEDWSPEFKQRVAEGRERSQALSALGRELEERSKLEAVESNSYCAPYVKGLSREQALTQIYFSSEVIRNGQEEKYTLSTSLDGKQTTSNFRQYVYWLQQHVKALDGGGTSSTLAQA
ncbi:hypothetical protein [Ferrovibrio sp.]|uniref:hypothetical protein n=1 Tax=Ferrovibrio sp. TaxID=1917215 RepID=UPI000CBBC04B|nr:hypothetical protein [Ferrovibrio sp.]PJI40185.1 MAG: hypothetical protein CTR53_10955 [Ferrovibrio sp.]